MPLRKKLCGKFAQLCMPFWYMQRVAEATGAPLESRRIDLIIRAKSIALTRCPNWSTQNAYAYMKKLLPLGPTSVIAMTELAEEITRVTSIFSLG